MSEALSFAEIDGQDVELLPARTVLSLFGAGDGGSAGTAGAGGAGTGGLGGNLVGAAAMGGQLTGAGDSAGSPA